MSGLLANIGRSVLVCQQIEVVLGTMLVLERNATLVDAHAFIEESAKARTKVLEALKNELTQQGVTYIDFAKLNLVIERRNWLIHKLPFDRRILSVARESSSDDFSDVFEFFMSFYRESLAAYLKRAKELGVGKEWSEEFQPMVTVFGPAIQERANEMKKKKK